MKSKKYEEEVSCCCVFELTKVKGRRKKQVRIKWKQNRWKWKEIVTGKEISQESVNVYLSLTLKEMFFSRTYQIFKFNPFLTLIRLNNSHKINKHWLRSFKKLLGTQFYVIFCHKTSNLMLQTVLLKYFIKESKAKKKVT